LNEALANAVLAVHAAFVIFVVAALPATWLGAALGRPFAFDRRFRAAHLAAIAFVVAQSALGEPCPLTVWEDALRGHSEARGFVARWVHAWLFWDAPAWVFTAAYGAFGALVALTWWKIPPRARRGKAR